MWTWAGKMGGESGLPTDHSSLEPDSYWFFHLRFDVRPPSYAGSLVKKSHIHTPYYCLKRSL